MCGECHRPLSPVGVTVVAMQCLKLPFAQTATGGRLILLLETAIGNIQVFYLSIACQA